MLKCHYCNYTSNRSFNMRRHEKMKHLSNPITNNNNLFGSGYNVGNIHGLFDLRLKENFKLFVTGPSRCGKTVFVSKLLENIHNFAKLPPTKVLYIYKVWQPKYDEIMSLGINFMEDNEKITQTECRAQPQTCGI